MDQGGRGVAAASPSLFLGLPGSPDHTVWQNRVRPTRQLGSGGGGEGSGHLDQRLWSFGKAVSRGRDLERPREGRLAGAQGLPS